MFYPNLNHIFFILNYFEPKIQIQYKNKKIKKKATERNTLKNVVNNPIVLSNINKAKFKTEKNLTTTLI